MTEEIELAAKSTGAVIGAVLEASGATLRIYAKVMGEQRRRGPGALLVSVLDGARWTEAQPQAETRANEAERIAIG